MALVQNDYKNVSKEKSLKKEMKRRTEYENGTSELYKFQDMKKAAIANYKEKSSYKK